MRPSPASFEAPYNDVWIGNGASSGVRNDCSLAVDRAGRRERNRLHAVGPRCLQDIEGRDGVLLEVLARVFRAEAHVRVCRHMKHNLSLPDGRVKPRNVEKVAFDEVEVRMK